jgi:RNA polymerase sigma-70 factor, ECF subfamily
VPLDEPVSMAPLVVLEQLSPAEHVARLLLAFIRRPLRHVRMTEVNGAPGLVMRNSGGVLSVVSITIDAGRITAVDIVRDPDRLTAVRHPGGAGTAGGGGPGGQ